MTFLNLKESFKPFIKELCQSFEFFVRLQNFEPI